MDRRKFVNSIALASAGALMFPSLGLFASENATLVELAPIQNHVRHGLLNFSVNASSTALTSSISSLQRNRFFKNGYSTGNDDPYSVSIETSKGENVQLFLEGDSVNCFINSILIKPKTRHCYRTESLDIKLINIEAGKSLSLNLNGKKTFFVALEGEPKVDNSTLKDSLGLVLENKQKVEVKATQASKLLLITEV